MTGPHSHLYFSTRLTPTKAENIIFLSVVRWPTQQSQGKNPGGAAPAEHSPRERHMGCQASPCSEGTRTVQHLAQPSGQLGSPSTWFSCSALPRSNDYETRSSRLAAW